MSNSLRGKQGATHQVTPKVPETEVQLHELVVMTHETALAAAIIITVKPSIMTCPSSNNNNNNNNQSTSTGSTLYHGASHELICFRCGKKGHMLKECPEPPQGFAAQVIQEDEEETPHAPDNHDAHDAHDDHEHEHGEQEVTPTPQETEEATEHSVDPNRSPYDSGNNEFPLDTFNEYIKVKESLGIATLSISVPLKK